MKYIDAWAKKASLASTTWRFLYFTTPFCCEVLGYDNQCSMHDWLRMRKKALNSLPQSNWDIWYSVKLVFYKICWIEETNKDWSFVCRGYNQENWEKSSTIKMKYNAPIVATSATPQM